MKKSDATKDQYLKAMAAHVLAHGLSTASLRPLAKAAGTSDRMLIYHFGSKDALIAALLAHIAGEFMTLLNEALPPGRAETRKACLGEIIAILRVDPFRQFMQLWLDIVAGSSHGSPAYGVTGGAIIDGFVQWLTGRLPATVAKPDAEAARMLTLIEGVLVMDSVGRWSVADAAINAMYADEDDGA